MKGAEIVEWQLKTGKIVEWQLFSKTNKLVERQSKTGKIREWQLRVSNMDKSVEWQPKTGKIVEWQLTTPKIKIFDFLYMLWYSPVSRRLGVGRRSRMV